MVRLEVADAGPGVAPHLASSVFERNVSGGSGSGLGLSLARALTEQMGGRLELVSRTPAVFGLFLPCDDGADIHVERQIDDQPAVSTVDGSGLVPSGSSARAASTVAGKTQRR